MNFIPLVTLGIVAVMYGVFLFYIFPLSLLQRNLGLILEVLFVILGSLILGLTILAFNF